MVEVLLNWSDKKNHGDFEEALPRGIQHKKKTLVSDSYENIKITSNLESV